MLRALNLFKNNLLMMIFLLPVLDSLSRSSVCCLRCRGQIPLSGPLDVTNSLGDLDAIAILRSVVEEGCIGETVAAVEARLGTLQ